MKHSASLLALAIAASWIALPAEAQDAKPERRTLQEAVDAPDWLKLSGSVRLRYESLANQFVAGRTGDDEVLGSQSLLKAEADTGEIIIGGELLDARRLIGNAGGSSAGEIDALEPLQLYLAWRPKDLLAKGDSLDVMLGRFSMDIGGRRLVSRSGFRHVLAAFDGVRGVWTSADGVKLTGFYTAPVNRAPSDQASALDNEVVLNPTADETRFGGVNAEAKLPLDITGDIYLYELDEDDGEEAATRNRDLSTYGIRLKRAPKAATWDFELEYARQTGSVRATTGAADITDLDHEADMLHAEAGWTFDAPWSPRLSLHFDHASGDESPTDLNSERFDPLFGDRAFELGPTGIYAAVARTNFNSPALRLDVKPDKASEALVSVRHIQLDEPLDSFANTNVRDVTGASGDDVGTQFELRYRRWLIPDSVRLAVGGAALIRDGFLKTAPNATLEGDTWYGYTELTFSF